MKRMGGGGANRRQAKKDAEEEKKQQNDVDSENYKFRLGEIIIKPCKESDESLGLMGLMKVMPETWQNVSWVISNGIEQLCNHNIQQRRSFEELKNYTMTFTGNMTGVFIEFVDAVNNKFSSVRADMEVQTKKTEEEFKKT